MGSVGIGPADLLDTFRSKATGDTALIIARPADKSDWKRYDVVQAGADGSAEVKARVDLRKERDIFRYKPV